MALTPPSVASDSIACHKRVTQSDSNKMSSSKNQMNGCVESATPWLRCGAAPRTSAATQRTEAAGETSFSKSERKLLASSSSDESTTMNSVGSKSWVSSDCSVRERLCARLRVAMTAEIGRPCFMDQAGVCIQCQDPSTDRITNHLQLRHVGEVLWIAGQHRNLSGGGAGSDPQVWIIWRVALSGHGNPEAAISVDCRLIQTDEMKALIEFG